MELVTLNTKDGIELDAAWYPTSGSKTGVLLVHGKAQNFYTSIVRWLGPFFYRKGFSSLALNMRDHDHGEIDGIPGAVHDIRSGVNFLIGQGIEKILLVGASYGSNKVVLYLPEAKKTERLLGLILLSAGGIKSYLPNLWKEVVEIIQTSPFPLLVIQAGADEHVPLPREAGEELINASANPAKAHFTIIDGANHGFSNNQEDVYKEINNWLISNSWLSR
jgi:pimeloyl-ACP methyl ester carboxylesterase